MSAKKKSIPKPAESVTKSAEPVGTPAGSAKPTTNPAEPVAEPVVPAPETKPVSLDDQARDLNDKIDDAESSSAGLLWELGGVLEGIRAQHPELKWGDFLKYADGLGSNKSRVTRALRIRHKFSSKALVEGMSIYEALGYDRHPLEPVLPVKKDVVSEPVDARITEREHKLAENFVSRFNGDVNRAMSVLVRYKASEETAEDYAARQREVRKEVQDAAKSGKSEDEMREILGKKDTETEAAINAMLVRMGLISTEPVAEPVKDEPVTTTVSADEVSAAWNHANRMLGSASLTT
jgi:hypothetical protein